MNVRAVGWQAVAIVLLAGVPQSFAQPPRPARVRIGINAGAQFDTSGLDQSTTLTKNAEAAPVLVEQSPAAVPLVDGGVTVRLAGRLGIGVSVSALSRTAAADLSASLPHPFFFERPRAVSGQEEVRRSELATHLAAVYTFVARRIDTAISGGVSFFNVEQDVVSDVIVADTYPYDSATFVQGSTATARESKTGYHVAGDLTWKIARSWGVGGVVRYSRATVPMAAEGIEATIVAGGLAAAGGLRVSF